MPSSITIWNNAELNTCPVRLTAPAGLWKWQSGCETNARIVVEAGMIGAIGEDKGGAIGTSLLN